MRGFESHHPPHFYYKIPKDENTNLYNKYLELAQKEKHNIEWRRDTATKVMKGCERHMAEIERIIPLFEIKTNTDLVA